ncbi:phosphotransferase [Kitasatospora sp. NPDC051853]|uniref:phosphotransferase n=1 Tax=Kitasatospora sp. NPDC051853 TaxID=3364058 RepID=UPI0037BD7402
MTAKPLPATPRSAAVGPIGDLDPTVLHVLEVAAERSRFNTAGATAITPTVFRLPAANGPSGVIAKIHPPGTAREALLRQTRIATWAADNHVPTARPIGRPTSVHGTLVTFTHDIGPGRHTDPEERAALLALLHALPAPTTLGLPDVAPTARLLRRLEAVRPSMVTDSAFRQLWIHLQQVERLWRHSEPLTRRRVVHGDLDPSNTVVGRDGIPHLINWHAAAVGPPALDLAAEAFRRDAFGSDPREYERFHAEYGHDVTKDDTGRTYETLAARAAAEGVITAAEHVTRDRWWLPEYLERLACLVGQGSPEFTYPWGWQASPRLTTLPDSPRAAVDQELVVGRG